jgi:GntR family transcriptional regulator
MVHTKCPTLDLMSDHATRPAKFEMVKQHLVAVIDGGLAPHEKLPTERELADEFEISRLTVRRALDQLESDGVVYRVQGAGTFVSENRIAKSFELTSFSEDMRARRLKPGSLSVSVETIPAGPRIGYALKLSPAEPVVHIQRVRTADDSPMCFENSYLPDSLVPDLASRLGDDSLYEVLDAQFSLRLDRAEQVINATVLEPDVASLLLVPPFSPSFLVTRTGYDRRGRPIEFAETLYRGDRYSYELTVLRNGSHRNQ